MVIHKGLRVEICSQYNCWPLPEYSIPDLTHFDTASGGKAVFVPVYQNSQFWITYDLLEDSPSEFLYFKLFIDNVHAVSWGCGQEEDYEGKTVFGLFDSGAGSADKERRSFYFPVNPVKADAACKVEVRVYRSFARKRALAPENSFEATQVSQRQPNRVKYAVRLRTVCDLH